MMMLQTSTPDTLPHAVVDMNKLTQSDLQALSLRSSSPSSVAAASFDDDDLLVPVIDRSVFNESAGSRRQTYSRPPKPQSNSAAASSSAHHHRNRLPGLLPTPKAPPVPADDPEHHENRLIVAYLKQYISQNPSPDFGRVELSPTPAPVSMSFVAPTNFGGERKRKRGRKPKVKVSVEESEVGLEIVNRNGVAVDVEALAGLVDPYGEELRRRTEGLRTEEELLGFLRDLGGQWGSRRKKRKIVDACVVGDVLPVGWKLLLGLKRKEGRASVYCRRYISPSGEHFMSCKEVSSYLRAYFGLKDAHRPVSRRTDDQFKHAIVAYKDDSQGHEFVSSSSKAIHYLPKEHAQDISLLGIDNLAEVQIRDLFECYKCNTTFEEKDVYLQHLLSFHQKTTRRYRLGSSVGDGVIMKDGKYECQFCHKVFEERRRYNGHVGIHVRNYVRKVGETPGHGSFQIKTESSDKDVPPLRISKMDALIEIAQSSILETSTNVDPDKASDASPHEGLEKNTIDSISETVNGLEIGVDSSINELDIRNTTATTTTTKETLGEGSSDKDGQMVTHVKGNVDELSDVVDVKVSSDFDTTVEVSASEQTGHTPETSRGKDDQVSSDFGKDMNQSETAPDKSSENLHGSLKDNDVRNDRDIKNSASGGDSDHPENNREELLNAVGGSQNETNDRVMKTIEQIFEFTGEENGAPDSFSKEENEQRNDDLAAFEEMTYEEVETLKYDFVTGQDPLTDVPVNLPNSSDMDQQYVSPVRFGSDDMILDVVARHQLTTVCVWCGVEFNHDGMDSELQSDSVGFMCPTCKAKISGQLNLLDGGFSSNSDNL